MSLVETIYHRLPIPMQCLMVNAWGAMWCWRRYGRFYREKLKELMANEHLSHDAFADWQLAALNRQLVFARRSPYYRELFAEANVREQMKSLAELSRIPLLSKQTLRLRSRDLLTGKPPYGTKVYQSSGTTGTPVQIFYTKKFHQQEMAYFQARVRTWAGVDEKAKRAMFGARKLCAIEQHAPPFWRTSSVENLTYYSIYHLAPQYLTSYIENLRTTQPDVLMGYPSALNLVAQYMQAEGIKLSIPVTITTSETLTPAIRTLVESTFQTKIYDQYGSVENAHFASQCEHGSYHVSPERGIVEILDEQNRPAAPGIAGRVVVTSLENQLQPLLRYDTGDVASWATNQQCRCGRAMPILTGIEGRFEDYCTAPDGRRVLRFDTVFKGVASVVEGQVIQESPTQFTINVVTAGEFSVQDRLTLIHNFHQHIDQVDVNIVIVPNIPRTASGKFRAVINRCHHQKNELGTHSEAAEQLAKSSRK
jgi:phenylacetate-CoA ligase